MEDNLNFLENGKQHQLFNMEDNLNILLNGRQPPKFKTKQNNAILKNSTAQLRPGKLTNTTTKNIA